MKNYLRLSIVLVLPREDTSRTEVRLLRRSEDDKVTADRGERISSRMRHGILKRRKRLLFYYAFLAIISGKTLAQMCSTPEKYRSVKQVKAKLNALLDNNTSPNAAGKLREWRTSSQGKPEKEKKIQEAGKPYKEEKRKEGKPEVEEVIRKKGQARKLDHKTEGAAKKASAESNAGKPESSGKKKVKKVKIEEPTKEVADEDQSAFVVEADGEGLLEKGEGLTLLINSNSDGLAVLQEDYEESD